MHVLSTPQVPSGLPSPTLTNPDMILPDSSPSESSPSTPGQHQRLPSPPPLEGNGYGPSTSAPDGTTRMKGAMYSPFQNGVLRRHDGSTRLRSSSEKGSNRIVFENNRLSYRQAIEVPFASSPTLEEDSRDRIYTESIKGDFENGEGTYTTPAILEEDEDDPRSHAAMTRRAEEILANAKRRLTDMEGNLNRARSTLQTRPSSSMSSFGNRSPEPVSLYSIPSKGRSPGGFSPSKHRQANLPSLDETKQRHLRVFSESSVPSLLQTGLPNGHSTEASTGASNGSVVNGADVASQDRHSEPSRNWFWSGLTRDTAPRYADRQAKGLEALNEDGPAPSFEQPAVLEENIAEERRSDLKSPAAAAFNEQNPPSTGLTRARSTAQMHDLREQMQDLKGKISTLKKRAREDNMRRRSLQSLRTPSPFTVAEQWYTGASLPEDIQREESNSGPLEHVQSSGVEETPAQPVLQDSGHASLDAEPMLDKKEANRSLEGDKSKEGLHEGREAIKEPPGDLSKMVNGFPSQKERLVLADEPATVRFDVSNLGSIEEASPIDLESREDSLYGDQDYHETSTSPIVERHEDRPDAFDYEHFVLNSALGTYSGVGMRRSSSVRKRAKSQSSESSVETTKPRNSIGDTPQADALSNGYHGRQNSVNSVSTDNTFATANEGADSEGGHDDWTFGHTKAGSRQVGADRKHKPNGSHESVPDHLVSNGIQKHGGKKHVASAQKGYVNGVNRKSPPAENGEMPQPPDLLTVLSSTGAWQEGAPPTKLKMGERDKEMVERLVKSLAKVCSEVDTLGPESSIYEARLFRRKLNDARRVLDGEMNGEAF